MSSNNYYGNFSERAKRFYPFFKLLNFLQAQEMTGVAVPKYYNPAAVNPLKYAEQVQKRKLLWSKAKEHKEVSVRFNPMFPIPHIFC